MNEIRGKEYSITILESLCKSEKNTYESPTQYLGVSDYRKCRTPGTLTPGND